MTERKNGCPDMLTAADLQAMGFPRAIAYGLLSREDIPVIKVGKRKFIRKEKFLEWIEAQETAADKSKGNE